MSFLNAEWRKLIMANYNVDPSILKSFVPAKTELDLYKGDCFVSLVGFMFLNTKLLGIKVPFHINFEEVNLRFYVRHHDGESWKRGVVFIKEIVPKPALSLVANVVYKEHYETMPMKHTWNLGSEKNEVAYAWKFNKQWHSIKVETEPESIPIPANSETEFITEHYWGYSMKTSTSTVEYEVTHPKWEHYPIRSHEIKVDFGKVYGKKFEILNNVNPSSVYLAEGSIITVESRKII